MRKNSKKKVPIEKKFRNPKKRSVNPVFFMIVPAVEPQNVI